jgi:succinylglutamic semialdehyde dehydrogenase
MAGSQLIDGRWIDGAGVPFASLDPTTLEPSWSGHEAAAADVNDAIIAARRALDHWRTRSLDERAFVATRFADLLKARRPEGAELIARCTGKPLWESATEIDAMIGKASLSIEAQMSRRADQPLDLPGGVRGTTRYKPHGVMVVLGPFNFPGHLPNGHIVPALLAGNTVVFKPSEKTPAVGTWMAQLWQEAGLPAGVFNLVQGGRDVAQALVWHRGIDGVLFTGSYAAGVAIARALADRPGVITALEMGGNNPLVLDEIADPLAGAYAVVQSAFITAGQRCSCARRLIVIESDTARRTLDALAEMTRSLVIGRYTDSPEPFCGPLIDQASALRFNERIAALRGAGATVLAQASLPTLPPMFVAPTVFDATGIELPDDELFGPLLLVRRVRSLPEALAEANATRYGLSAGLLSDSPGAWSIFERDIRAGVLTWNRPTTGASSALPFGGVGDSGNHRPSAYHAADYCSYPVASTTVDRPSMPAKPVPGVTIHAGS